jgi:hypothetical protein
VRPNGKKRPSGVGRRRLTPVLIGVVPLLLAACGSAAASGASSSTTKPAGKASEAAYTSCLKQHGVTLPTFGNRGTGTPPAGTGTPPPSTPGSGSFPGAGGFGGGGAGFRNNPKFKAAAAACKSLRPAGGFGGFGRGGTGGFNSTALAAYRNCLKLHGVTLPTTFGRPSPGAGSTTTTTNALSSPAAKAAVAACAPLRPSPTSTTTTPG